MIVKQSLSPHPANNQRNRPAHSFAASLHYVAGSIYYIGQIVFITVTIVIPWLITIFISYFKSHGGITPAFLKSAISPENAQLLYEWRYGISIFYVAVVLTVLFRFYLRMKKRWRVISSQLDHVQIQYVQLLKSFQEFCSLVSSGTNHDAEREKFRGEYQRFIRELLEKASIVFREYTGYKCHTCIKGYERGRKISTLARDGSTSDDRTRVDEYRKSYHYTENTAFEQIIDNPNVSYFYSNHLIIRSVLGMYSNSHVGWRRYYNACAVVPLTDMTSSEAISTESVVGFLCVDNKRWGFDDRSCKNLLFFFSRILFHVTKLPKEINSFVDAVHARDSSDSKRVRTWQ